MVRLMLIRHAESVQNAYMEDVFGRIRRKELHISDFNKAMRDAPVLGAAAGDDSPLTDLGKSQARRLGLVWADLLEQKAKSGKLIVYVSPFTRTLQTADPLLSELSSRVPGFSAVLLPHIMEAGGLAHSEDFRKLDAVERLNRQGKRDEAVQLLKSIKWQPQGLTVSEITKQFPWAKVANKEDIGILGNKLYSELPIDTPWWEDGYETRKRALRRVEQVISWLLKTVAGNETGKTDDESVVLMISHGQTIAHICNALTHHAYTENIKEHAGMSFEGIRNTSMTSIFIPSSDYDYLHERPDANGETIRFRCRLEFFNDTTHLGNEKLHEYGKNYLGARL